MNSKDQIAINNKLISVISPADAWEYEVLPVEETDDKLVFALSDDKLMPDVAMELEILCGKEVVLVHREKQLILKALKKYYPNKSSTQTLQFNDDFLDKIIQEARLHECSDIHFETFEDECRVRIRIDGRLVEKYQIPEKEYRSIINKIKIKANLNIAERRLPQDGRILYNKNNFDFDIRVSILPTLNGEKVVLRLLQKEAHNLTLDNLGMNPVQLERYRDGIMKSHGIVLISGPTGSGKTTTLYATLKEINTIDKNILTIEDPIEYTIKGINQVQLKESIGLTFASALKTFLRQDPDIIMLGEIRDPETAQMASRAALTGHLVFSTIHTNSAFGIISRLSDMGIPSYLIASTLCLAVAQRLVRVLCPDCKVPVKVEPERLSRKIKHINLPEMAYEEVGCDSCNQTGFKGRKAIYEVIGIDDEVSELIRNEKLTIKYLTSNQKMVTLADSAINLFSAGQTSLSEIYPILISNLN